MIICAGKSETFDFATSIGVGLVESAINLTRLCLFDRPEYLLFVGSAGSYGNHKILDIVESNISSNIELSFLQNNSYTPIDNVIKSYNENVSHETSSEPDKNIVNSSNYITTDAELAKRYLNHNIELENMEFFSVLKVAQEFEIPAAGIFVITNYCDKSAHEKFMKNHKEAMEKLSSYIKKENDNA